MRVEGSGPRRTVPEVVTLAALVLVPIVFSRVTVENFEFPKTSLMIIAALALLGWWMSGEIASGWRVGLGAWVTALPGRIAHSARSDPAGAALILFLASATISTITSINRTLSLYGTSDSYAGLPVAFATASIYFAARSASRDPAFLRRIAGAAALAAWIASGYALLQLLNLDPLGWYRTASFGGAVRIFGTLGHPNFLGAYLVMAFPLIVWRGGRASTRAARIGFFLLAAMSLAGILATLSRAAWLGLTAVALAWGGLSLRSASVARTMSESGRERGASRSSRRHPVLIVAATATVAIVLLLPAVSTLGPNLANRFREIASLSSPTTRSRLEIWRAAIRMTADHPVLGVGIDAFASAFPSYRTTSYWKIEWGGTPTKAHNEVLGILATQGALGAIAALLVVGFVARAVWRAVAARHPPTRDGAVIAGAALVGFAVQDLASFTTVALGTLAAALAGWAAAQASGEGGAAEAARAGGRGATTPRSPAGLLFGAGVVVAGFVPLVLTPWRGEVAAFQGLANPIGTWQRDEGMRRAAEIAPWHPRYHALLGRSLVYQGLREENPNRRWTLLASARSSLTRALVIDPNAAFERALLGRTLACQSELKPDEVSFDQAQAAFAEALGRDPANSFVLVQLEETYLQLNRDDEAHFVATKLAGLYPDFAKPFADIGVIALRGGRNQDAADTLSIAVRKYGYDDENTLPDAWSNLAAANVNLKRFDAALMAAERALELSPGHAGAASNRVAALRGLGRAS